MSDARPVTAGRWVGIFMAEWIVMWVVVLGLVGLGLQLPVHRLAIPLLLMWMGGLIMSFLTYWARDPVDKPMSNTVPGRWAVVAAALVNVLGTAALWSAVMLGLVSRDAAIREYLPWFLPLSLVLALYMFWYWRRRVRAA